MLSSGRQLEHMMRGLTPHKGALADGKPSKLEMMRADYQKKLMKEKEVKMIQMYEDNQKKVLMRMAISENGNTHNGVNGGKSVWKYNERQRHEANSVTSTDSLSRQTNEVPGSKEWSGRVESGASFKMQKTSSGRVLSQPLAPIRRPPDTKDVENIARSGIPQRLPAAAAAHGDGNPFLGRPRLVKHKPLPPTSHNPDYKMAGDPKAMQTALPGYKLVPRRSPQTLQLVQPRPADTDNQYVDSKGERQHSGTQGKLTDFQKWQVEQAEARDGRLKRLNEARLLSNYNDGAWRLSDDEATQDSENSETLTDKHKDGASLNKDDKKQGPLTCKDDKKQGQLTYKEKELMDKIASRQRELEKIRQEREEQEEQEKLELERQKKSQSAGRVRQQRLDEEKQREEATSDDHEENGNRLERVMDEKLRKEDERRMNVDEKRMKEGEKRRQQEEKAILKRQRENERASSTRNEKLHTRSHDSRENCSGNDEDTPSTRPSASAPKISRDPKPSKSKMDASDPDERRLSLSDAHVYEQAAASYDAQGVARDLANCQICGRSFVKDRLKKHQDACAKANKPRKEFDSAKKRVEGTELAKYAGKARRSQPPKKKSNWRATHEEFIQSLRYAKKVTKCEQEGGDLKKLTPPPVSRNPDYVSCPHCGRSFNVSAAERHIPRCQSLKTRPLPINTRRR